LLLLAALVYGYRALISLPRVDKAAEMISEAQYRFEAENADYALALSGDANGAGFLDVIEKYGSTPAGNLAKHYAGICYLKTGDMANAATYLAKFSTVKGLPGALINAQNYGLQGDIAVDKQDYAAALKFYDKAVKAADNNLTAPMYLRKAGLVEQALGNKEKAAAYFEQILSTYPASYDAREAEKLLGTNE
ncbi:MAG: tetratricopeptide repeat protein, partial [Alistipes sp.]